jgi:SP family facilitated glucose transporter-like MFS transporter 1
VIAIMMMLAQQLTGINAIIFYSTDVFVNAGLSHENAQFATIGLGVANVFMTIVAIFAIEKAGRKTLLLIGLVGMLASTIGLFACLKLTESEPKSKNDSDQGTSLIAKFSVFSLVAYIVFFALGPGPIPWFLVSELFKQNARPVATAVAVGVNWMANFIISWAFQPITTLIGPYVFLIFMVTMAFFIFYTYSYVPETKDRTITEITEQFT